MNPFDQVELVAQKQFETAITSGRLSAEYADANYAGRYMYMHTDANGKDHFKHINTREYLK